MREGLIYVSLAPAHYDHRRRLSAQQLLLIKICHEHLVDLVLERENLKRFPFLFRSVLVAMSIISAPINFLFIINKYEMHFSKLHLKQYLHNIMQLKINIDTLHQYQSDTTYTSSEKRRCC